jgi:ubiquinone biosynthesis protein
MTKKNDSSKFTSSPISAATAIPKELWKLSTGWWKHTTIGLSWRLTKAAVSDSQMVSWGDGKVYAILGDALIGVIDAWGPLYGKAMQVLLSRMSKDALPHIERLGLDRVYGDWPPLAWNEVQFILDREIPRWREELRVETRPLGVASMSQVHVAHDSAGRKWVIKLLKPASMERLTESIAAIESAVAVAQPFAMTKTSKRFLRDVEDLCKSLAREMNLTFERETMTRVHDLIASHRQKSLRVPALHPLLGSSQVIVMELLEGVKISDIVSGKANIDEKTRRGIARNVLSELLVQIFEWGLFHADPHAGNLMMLSDGTVGLYDWGLAGELLETDRKFISRVLKSVMAGNIEMLIDVLVDMGREAGGREISRESVRSELNQLIVFFEAGKGQGGEMPGLQVLVDAALSAADRLGIPMPSGLLLMAKSLVTIEGLARGIDENVPFARVAGPVLFKASDPGLSDVMALAKQIPGIIKSYLRKD